MKKFRIILIAGLVIVAFGFGIRENQHADKDKCPQPLSAIVAITPAQGYTLGITEEEFKSEVQKAVTEWEDRTHLDLFDIVSNGNALARSGLISTITVLPKDLTIFDLSEITKSQVARTEGNKDDKGRVTRFNMEVYETNPLILHQIILHELGHARGLDFHSSSSADIMYWKLDDKIKNLSDNDVALMLNYCQSK